MSSLRSSVDRRTFMKGAGAAAFALGTGVSSRSLAKADEWAGFRMGIQSYSLRGFSFEEAVGHIKALGLGHVELFSGHLSHQKPFNTDTEAAIKLMKDSGIVPDAYGVSRFTKDEAANRPIFEFGKKLGLIALSADPDEDSFDTLDKLVEEYKIPIAIHNHGPHHKWGKPDVILAAIKDHHPLIGLCADTGHFLRAGVDPVDAIRILKGRVYGFHVKDFVDEETEKIAGEGKLDLTALFKEAKAQGFTGSCSIEYELTPEDPIAGIAKGIENIRKAIAAIG